jgi:hypothetical protein
MSLGEKDGGGGSAGWKVAHRRRLEHDRSAVLRETGVGEPMAWKLAFEHGYENGFKKVHPAP